MYKVGAYGMAMSFIADKIIRVRRNQAFFSWPGMVFVIGLGQALPTCTKYILDGMYMDSIIY